MRRTPARRQVVLLLALLHAAALAARPTDDLLAEAYLLAGCDSSRYKDRIGELLRTALEQDRPSATAYMVAAHTQELTSLVSITAGFEAGTATALSEKLTHRFESIQPIANTEAEDATVRQLVEKLPEDIRASLLEAGKEMVGRTSQSDQQTLALYVAATQVDPGSTYAWYRIAIRHSAGTELRQSAVRALARCDSENALPSCLLAVDCLDRGHLKDARTWVRKGNEKQHLCFPQPPIPQSITLRYPRDEFFSRLGVAGQIVGREVIETICTSTSILSDMPMTQGLRRIAKTFVAEGEKQERAGVGREALTLYQCVADLGLMMMRARPGSSLGFLRGIAIYRLPLKRLERTLEESGSKLDVKRLHEVDKAVSQAFSEVRKLIGEDADRSEDDLMRSVLQGRETVSAERRVIARILRETGLATLRLAPPQD